MPVSPGPVGPPATGTASDLWNPTMMAERPGWLLSLMGRIFFRPVRFETAALQRLRDAVADGPLVYVMPSQSLLDYLYFNWAFLRLGLPLAIFGTGMLMWPFRTLGSQLRRLFRLLTGRARRPATDAVIESAPAVGRPVVLFLRRARTLLPWFGELKEDPLGPLITAQDRLQKPIQLCPVLIVWERSPTRLKRSLVDLIFGDPDAPGRIRKLLNFILNHRRAFVQVGDPLDLRRTLAEARAPADGRSVSEDELGRHIRWLLNQRVDVEHRIIKGPLLKTGAEMRDEILRLDPLVHRLQEVATASGRTVEEVKKEARGYLKEIVADWRLGYIEVQAILLTFVFSRIYAGIELEGLPGVREAAKRAPLVILPSHKSHIDYLLISYMFHAHGIVPPHIAAGNNLNFFPLGHIFRRSGAFYLRRSFAQNALYSFVFKTYMQKLMKEGYAVEFFIEGGRSRTGKVLPPKYGLLSHVVDAVLSGHTHDLSICPAAIGYQKIIEGESYIRELSGADKQKEDLGELMKATGVLVSRYGRVHLRFSEPFSLREFLIAEGCVPGEDTGDDAQRRRVVKRLAYRVLSLINQEMVVTPSAVLATALLGNPRRGIGREALLGRIGAILDFLLQSGAALSSVFTQALAANRVLLGTVQPARAEGMSSIAAALSAFDGESERAQRLGAVVAEVFDEALSMFVANKWLTRKDYGSPGSNKDVVYQLAPDKRLELDYYKNNVIHHFARESLLSAALLRGITKDDLFGDRLRRDVALLSGILKYEYVFKQGVPFDTQYRETLQGFEDAGLIRADRAARVTVTRRGERTARLLASLTLPVLEGYIIAIRGVAELTEPVPEKQLMEDLQRLGDRLWREGRTTFREGISSVTLDHALGWLREQGHLGRESRTEGRKNVKWAVPGPKRAQDPEALPALATQLSEFLLPHP